MNKPWFDAYPAGTPHEIVLPASNTSLVDVFERTFQQFGDRDAFVCMDKRLTYKELDQKSRQFAAYLQSLGLKKGAKVAVMLPNVLQYPIALIGILRAGYVLVNVNPLYTARELEHQLKDSGAEVIVVLENFAHVLQEVIANTPVKHTIVTSAGELLGLVKGFVVDLVVRRVRKQVPSWVLPGSVNFNHALNKVSARKYQRPVVGLSDTAILQYTGGTTGVSKGAELTHSNLVSNLLQTNAFFSSVLGESAKGAEESILCALPLYHIFALMVCALYGLQRGQLIILIPNPRDIPGLIKEIDKYKPSFFPAVNTLFNALAHNEDFQKLDFSKLKLSMGGGMAVLPATAALWQKITKTPILEGYGLSETSPIATANPVNITAYSGTIGIPLPSTEVAILDDDGKEVALGERGEISIRGPQVMKGYWQRPDETAKVMTADGYFRTGDIGIMDERGYTKIVDRKKDMILVSGFNVYPAEIEEVITNHPKVLEAAAIGVPDDKSGEVPKLFVVKKDPSLTEAELKIYINENLTGYKRPKYIEFLAELPKSNVGKILRKELRK
ncbi:long-chain-fatty-acid--CoA ligase [Aquirhabdus parva]|uniref:Long-chain-fatty-acid--CoA ligase n=1 Tax=Aquirhabdus parva TaxID=2283318 RepID=A0A345PAC5_9GAMM|nr:long-chain-fatty-acid--CoA ligase [Aquirhabdus parva]AXI04234.1 long-chain-fatty-acid--CoA ligase [Aquirhabdus parva]